MKKADTQACCVKVATLGLFSRLVRHNLSKVDAAVKKADTQPCRVKVPLFSMDDYFIPSNIKGM